MTINKDDFELKKGKLVGNSAAYKKAIEASDRVTYDECQRVSAFNADFVLETVDAAGERAIDELAANPDADRVVAKMPMLRGGAVEVRVDRSAMVRDGGINEVDENGNPVPPRKKKVYGRTTVKVTTAYGRSSGGRIKDSRSRLAELAKKKLS